MSKTTDNGLKRAEKTRSNRLNLSDLHGFAPGLCKLPKGCTRLAAANAKACQLLAHGGWFSQGTPESGSIVSSMRSASMLVMLVLQSIYMNQIKGMFY
jgi:hypothetical protein